MHQWFYMQTGLFSGDQVGPISEPDLRQLLLDGKLELSTQISSPTRTKGQWVKVESIKAMVSFIERGESNREEVVKKDREKRRLKKEAEKEKAEIVQPLADPLDLNPYARELPSSLPSSIARRSKVKPPKKKNFLALQIIIIVYYTMAVLATAWWLFTLVMLIIATATTPDNETGEMIAGLAFSTFAVTSFVTVVVVTTLCAFAEVLRLLISVENNTRLAATDER